MTTLFKFRWLAAMWLAVSLLAGAGASPASALGTTTCPAAPNEGDVVVVDVSAASPTCMSGGTVNSGIYVTNNLLSNNTITIAIASTGNNGSATCAGGGCRDANINIAPSAGIACDTSLGSCGIVFSDSVRSTGYQVYMLFDIPAFSTAIPAISVAFNGSQPLPNITSITPGAVSSSGGTTVVLTGNNFTGASAVTFNLTQLVFGVQSKTAISFVVDSDSQITAVSPTFTSVLVLSSSLTVTTSAGTSNPASFTLTSTAPLVFTRPANQIYASNTTFDVSPQGGPGITYASSTRNVCTTDSTGSQTVTMTGAGTCTITASVVRTNGTTSTTESVTQSLFIQKQQTITTFTPPPPTDFSAGSVTLLAVADSGLPVRFASTTPKVCTTNGATVTFVDAGVCQITASQPGSPQYLAASPVMRDFTINAIPQTVTFNSQLPDVSLAATKIVKPLPTATGGASGNPVTITSSTKTVCTVDGTTATILSAGTCTIMASQDGGNGYASASASQSFKVTNTAQLVEFTMPIKDQLTTSPVGSIKLEAKVTPAPPSGTNVVFAASTTTGFPIVCTVSDKAVTIVGVGQCTLTATVPGYVDSSGNQFDNGTATQTFNVSAAPQTLNFTKPADQVYSTTTPVPLVATGAAPGNTVTFASNTPKVCTATGANATITGVGTCVISASAPAYKAAGGTGYNPQYAAGNAVATFNVTKVPQTLAFANTAASLSFTDTQVSLKLTDASALAAGNTVVFTSTTPRVCTVSGTSAALVGAGTCNLTATAPAFPATAPDTGPQYAVGTATYSFTVVATPQPLVLTLTPTPANLIYPAAPITLAVTGAGNGGTVTIVSTTPAVCTVTGVTATGATANVVGAGKCILTATVPAYAASGVHYDVGTATQSFSIAQALQTITFTAPSNQKYVAGKSIPLTATNAPSVAASRITFSSTTPSVCIVSGSQATMAGGGTCTITASLLASANYAAASDVTASFTISNAPQTISFTNPGTMPFVLNQTVPLTVTGGGSTQPVVLTASPILVCTVTNGAKPTATIAGIGMCSITANQAGDTGANPVYLDATPVTQSFLIAGSAQTISFTKPADLPLVAGGPVTLDASSIDAKSNVKTGNLIAFTSTTPLVCTVANGVSPAVMVRAGTCTIKASQAGNTTYAPAADVVVSFVIQSAIAVSGRTPQTIKFTNPGAQTFSSTGSFSLTASSVASSKAVTGNIVTFGSNTTGVCTVDSGTVSMKSVGTCSITASQMGDTIYAPAANVTQVFTITKGVQTIIFTAPSVAPFALSATGGASGNPVVFTSLTPAVCTASGGTAKIVAAGTCTIVASQAGNVSYLAANNVTQSFSVSAPVKQIARSPVLTTGRLSSAALTILPPVSGSTTLTTGFNEDSVQQGTRSAVQNSLSQRANALTSSGSDTTRMHSRLSGGTLSGEDVGESAAQEGPATSVAAAAAHQAGNFARPGDTSGGASSGLGLDGSSQAAGGGSFVGSVSRAGRTFDMPFGTQRDYAGDDRDHRTSMSPFNFSGSAEGGVGQFSFSTSLSQMRAANEASEAQKRASLTTGTTTPLGLAQDARSGSDSSAPYGLGLGSGIPAARSAPRAAAFDIWVDGVSSYYVNDSLNGRSQGQTFMMHTGADYVVRPGLLIGMMGQMDWTSQTTSALTQNSDGLGWMVGPYMSARLTRNLYFDARAAWGQSVNHVDPFGAFTDTFSTTRVMTSAKLTGDWSWNDFRFKPSAEVIYIAETQKAYTNAIGIDIGGQSVALGRTVFGPEIGYRMRLDNNSVFEPFVGFKGIWDFNSTQEAAAPGSDGLRGRIEGGFNWSTPSGISVRGAGSYDGLGSGSYHAVQGQAAVIVPLQ